MSPGDSTTLSAFEHAETALSNALDLSFGDESNTSNSDKIVLQPHSFFVSWNGVLCLVFRGFPLSLEKLKSHLNNECSAIGYRNENSGSKWAKVTLAFVREQSEVHPLTLEKFQVLKEICRDCSTPFTNKTELVPTTTVSLVEYEWRSLEKISRTKEFELSYTCDETSAGIELSPEQQAKTHQVLLEWDEDESYLKNVNTPGAPYRLGSTSVQCNRLTCVTFLDLKSNPNVWQAICNFRCKIDETFPGRHEWLKDESLHCTIRAMDKE
eukprot:CCRYP_017474-RA/>CCRYP_017474-RA protein AED:0.03 eAED:0.03 QI:614/1/1/1/0/0/2/81/267